MITIKKIKSFKLTFILIILFINCSDSDQSAKELSKDYLAKIMRGNFLEAAQVLHYPKEYTEKELEDDVKNVTNGLRIISHVLGMPQESRLITETPPLASVYVHSSTPKFWEWHSVIGSAAFYVSFQNSGPGYIIFTFADVNGDTVLKKVEYGLQADQLSSKKIISEIFQKMMQERSPVLPEKSVKQKT